MNNLNLQKVIISKIRDLINYKSLEPRDKLPSERMLSEKFEVKRSNVREAIQQLEFYGLLNSIPQSGTFVSNIGVIAINGIIDEILRLEDSDSKSLAETRIVLELKMVQLAAIRRSEENLEGIKKALEAYIQKVMDGENATQEDILFHLSIAKASGNSTINKFLLQIIPETIANDEARWVSDKNLVQTAIIEYNNIYEAIKNQNPKLAQQKMKEHFKV